MPDAPEPIVLYLAVLKHGIQATAACPFVTSCIPTTIKIPATLLLNPASHDS